jgi:hypothetical protein
MGTPPLSRLMSATARRIIVGMSALKRFAIIVAGVFLVTAVGLAAKQFVMPRALPISQYPAHDVHPMEHVGVAADPYDTREKQRELFVGDYLNHSLLPIFVVITNNNDQPISLTNIRMELLTRDRAKASPSNDNDLYRRFTKTKRYEDKSTGSRKIPYPIPLPKGDQGAVKKELREEFDASQFFAKAVEPHGTQSGFVFFDIGGLENPTLGATLTITGVKDAEGNALMFFEVPLDKYANLPK